MAVATTGSPNTVPHSPTLPLGMTSRGGLPTFGVSNPTRRNTTPLASIVSPSITLIAPGSIGLASAGAARTSAATATRRTIIGRIAISRSWLSFAGFPKPSAQRHGVCASVPLCGQRRAACESLPHCDPPLATFEYVPLSCQVWFLSPPSQLPHCANAVSSPHEEIAH
jgi:hypothetical protein